MKKLNPKVYRKSAEHRNMLQYFTGVCYAISIKSRINGAYNKNKYILEFEKYFKPDYSKPGSYYFGNLMDEKNLLARQIALDLMAEILES